MLPFPIEFFLWGLAAFLSTTILDMRGLDAPSPWRQPTPWRTIAPPAPTPLMSFDEETGPPTSQHVFGCGFYLPLATETPFPSNILPTATEPDAAPSAPSIAHLPEIVISQDLEDDDEEMQDSRQQWIVDSFFAVMNILLAIFMTFGQSTDLLGFVLRRHHQVFVAIGRKNRALRSKIAALQSNPVLFALPPPTSDEYLDEFARTALGSTQTEAATCSSLGVQTEAAPCSSIGVQTEAATCSSIGIQTSEAGSVSVWTQTDAVQFQSVGTQATPDAAPEDSALVAELRAALAKQRKDSDDMIRGLQASLARLGAESGQLRAQLARNSRLPVATPSPGGTPTFAGLAYDPHHNPNPQANAQQLAQNMAMQQRLFHQSPQQSPQQPPRWQPSPGWQGQGNGQGRGHGNGNGRGRGQ